MYDSIALVLLIGVFFLLLGFGVIRAKPESGFAQQLPRIKLLGFFMVGSGLVLLMYKLLFE
jgi:hypothetical protein